MNRLKEAGDGRGEHERQSVRSRPRLTLEEVRASGLPAFFFDHGEHLLYLDEELYDIEDGDTAWEAGSHPEPLPRQILIDGVGIEHGWRHAAGCACHHCQKRAPRDSSHEAVA